MGLPAVEAKSTVMASSAALQEQFDGVRAQFDGGYVSRSERRMEVLRPVPGHDAHDREVPGDGPAHPGERVVDPGHSGLVHGGDRRQLGVPGQQLLRARLTRLGVVGTARHHAPEAALIGRPVESGPRAVTGAVSGRHQFGAAVDQSDVTVTQVGQMVDASGDERLVVEVHP